MLRTRVQGALHATHDTLACTLHATTLHTCEGVPPCYTQYTSVHTPCYHYTTHSTLACALHAMEGALHVSALHTWGAPPTQMVKLAA
jgi:hypothetical protein